MQKVRLALIQEQFKDTEQKNLSLAIDWVKRAAKQGAQIVLLPELFAGLYFCKVQEDSYFSWAHPIDDHPWIHLFQDVAREYQVVLPVSFFEKDGPHYYNSLVVLDANGKSLGIYRKSHIPDGPGYQEKYYFRPGNTGFKVFSTRYLQLGIGICWDQWFPECARLLALQGAQLILYPTAIGSEPGIPSLQTKDLWQRAMIGHAMSNVIPLAAANRIGEEEGQLFYGHSFISDHFGNKIAEFGEKEAGVLFADLDLEEAEKMRASFGFFRDRRVDLYEELLF